MDCQRWPAPDELCDLTVAQIDAIISSLRRRREALTANGRKPNTENGAAARRLYAERRRRNSWLDATLFSEPAWDMLLDLYASAEEGRALSISDVGIAACVPPTTSLRWLGQMEKLGLVRRSSDMHDRRRVWVELTEQGRAAITGYLTGERGPRA
ncbi:winged helix DNA-binding protein [Flavisphingomonas formosensis]|uniref:winged helix DNA-binding protein n=1 Tax=Flavisphingomonas formosensis TaxID=861534 RepID=UPI001E449D9E|nr:winged helix DNA-binding protein [Sphingomonas formosensis]